MRLPNLRMYVKIDSVTFGVSYEMTSIGGVDNSGCVGYNENDCSISA